MLLACHALYARVWYVKATGNDNNDGRTEQTAMRTLQYVADRVNPGDVVLVGDGNYTSDNDEGVLCVNRSGTAKKWITWRAIKG